MLTKTTLPDFTIASREFEPAYMALHRSGELRRRAAEALERLAHCLVCPRNCGVDRMADKTVEAVPRHHKIGNKLARKICRNLSVPDVGQQVGAV